MILWKRLWPVYKNVDTDTDLNIISLILKDWKSLKAEIMYFFLPLDRQFNA